MSPYEVKTKATYECIQVSAENYIKARVAVWASRIYQDVMVSHSVNQTLANQPEANRYPSS